MNTQKIKSIKVIKDFPNNIWKIGKQISLFDYLEHEDEINEGQFSIISEETGRIYPKDYPEFFEIEYEKPKQYFNKNGSVQLPLEEGQGYWFIGYRAVYDDGWENDEADFYMLKTENIFLTEEDAEKALDQKNKGLEVLEKLKEINRENDWVENLDGSQYNYYVGERREGLKVSHLINIRDQGVFYFCKEASEYFISLPKEDKEAFFNLK